MFYVRNMLVAAPFQRDDEIYKFHFCFFSCKRNKSTSNDALKAGERDAGGIERQRYVHTQSSRETEIFKKQ